ncbi:unnamed protein product [Orchesella dallaii]|uniref:Uncharacterized protein n=1 Tax=Orchesella dallaii TaxID=48710 RepID=A0ABP1R8G3_9HEXA
MAFGRSDEVEHEGRIGGGNRPDCAYFLLLGLCGAAFLLTIGGILTYIAFNPGAGDSRPHSPLSHIPHFHHHRKHHDRTEGHYFGHYEQHNYHHDELKQHHQPQQHQTTHNASTTGKPTVSSATELPHPPTTIEIESNETSRTKGNDAEKVILSGENGTTPGSHLETAHLAEEKKQENSSITSSSSSMPHKNGSIPTTAVGETGKENGKDSSSGHHQQAHLATSHHNYNKNNSSHHPLLESSSGGTSHTNQQQQQIHPHPGIMSTITHHDGTNSYEYKAKQSLALAIIGPLCLLMGIIVTLIVGVFALKYDCDHEPEPNIAFLRLRSEMSLNFDPSKNNYELLMPASSSNAGVGSTHSIHPGGMPRC